MLAPVKIIRYNIDTTVSSNSKHIQGKGEEQNIVVMLSLGAEWRIFFSDYPHSEIGTLGSIKLRNHFKLDKKCV